MALALVDTHAHLDDPRFAEDLEAVLRRAHRAGVWRVVTVGTDVHSSRQAVRLADREGVFAAVGLHPNRVDPATLDDDLEALLQLAECAGVVAWGEIGLDHYRDYVPWAAQREAFVRQLRLSREVGLPVLIHNRRADDELVAVLAGEGRPIHGVLHCFSGGPSLAHTALGMGLLLGIGGPLTFRNAGRLPEVVRDVPMDRLVVETDAPYLAPEPHRGRRNEPGHVRHVAERLAQLTENGLEFVARATSAAACQLFGWPAPPRAVRHER